MLANGAKLRNCPLVDICSMAKRDENHVLFVRISYVSKFPDNIAAS